MEKIPGFTLTEEGDIIAGEASKKYACEYAYDDDDEDNNCEQLIKNIINDEELPNLNEIIIGLWGDAMDSEEIQIIIDGIVESQNKGEGKFSHIKSIFFGDMTYEDCEVSWIIQGDYSKLWAAMPNLEKFGVRGSQELELYDIKHEKLREFDIICGGLGSDVIESVKDAKLPALERLTLYIGIEDYGFDGDINDIKKLLDKSDFPNLKHLGLEDSEIQDEITEAVFNSKYISQIESLSLANGTLTDKGGQIILDKLKSYPNIKELNLHYNYLSEDMCEKLEELAEECGVKIDVDDSQEADEYNGELWYSAMLTE